MMPVSEVRPVVRVTIAAMVERAIAAIATAVHVRGAEAAAVKTTATKTSAMEATTAETAAMEATTVEATTSAVEPAAAMAATTAVATANLNHRSVGRDFRRRRSARAGKRERLSALLCTGGENEDGRSS
jgi:hypothetical protein